MISNLTHVYQKKKKSYSLKYILGRIRPKSSCVHVVQVRNTMEIGYPYISCKHIAPVNIES